MLYDSALGPWSYTNLRCTNATVQALGGQPKRLLRWGTSVLQSLSESGISWRPWGSGPHRDRDLATLKRCRTVRAFVKAHPRGKFYLSTAGHAMALVDGVLTDTTQRGPDGRWVQSVVEILSAS